MARPRVIKVSDKLNVIVTFTKQAVSRMAPDGFSDSDLVQCIIFNAEGLAPLGGGLSLRSEDDTPDYSIGRKAAFERAVKDAFPLDKEIRAILHREFRDAVVIQDQVDATVESLKTLKKACGERNLSEVAFKGQPLFPVPQLKLVQSQYLPTGIGVKVLEPLSESERLELNALLRNYNRRAEHRRDTPKCPACANARQRMLVLQEREKVTQSPLVGLSKVS